VLRRQMHRRFRKPLIVMSPKSLLRHPRAVSALREFSDSGFHTVLDDPAELSAPDVQRVLLCSGKIFYTLEKGRIERQREDIACLRIEQLYPFPASELIQALKRYNHVDDVRWVQEEPKNQGAYFFVEPLIEKLLEGRQFRYVGRDEASSPATGNYKVHQQEEAALIEEALKRPREARRTPAGTPERATG
jgi:2-oxoglutarate dehydrogenase E1 component